MAAHYARAVAPATSAPAARLGLSPALTSPARPSVKKGWEGSFAALGESLLPLLSVEGGFAYGPARGDPPDGDKILSYEQHVMEHRVRVPHLNALWSTIVGAVRVALFPCS